jgi:tripartite-type tricarboxylate transporter receptor subunit TctC
MTSKTRLLAWLFCAAVFTGVGAQAVAQSFPTKPLRIVVPFTPAGPTDTYARLVARGLAQNLGQPVLVDNRPGASGIIGSQLVAKAAPDGYTLLFTATHHSVNLSVYKSLPYDTERDFTPLALVATNPSLLAAHAGFAPNTVAQLIALAKAKPGELNYASNSVGGGSHLSMELFKAMAGLDIVHIPYKGQAPAVTDLIGGRISLMFTSVGPTIPHVKAGRLKALAVSGTKRVANLPSVPTVAETVPGYEANSWFGLWGPGHMPNNLVIQLNAEIAKVLHSAEAKKLFAEFDAEPGAMSAVEFATYQKREIAKWAKLIRTIDLKPE